VTDRLTDGQTDRQNCYINIARQYSNALKIDKKTDAPVIARWFELCRNVQFWRADIKQQIDH